MSEHIDITYIAERTAREFHADDSFVRGIRGNIGCVAPDTMIVTDQGQLPICEIDRPMRVLSWNDQKGQFQYSPTGGAFPKGIDYLYRVTTPSGVFDAAGHHLLLCADGKYQRVDTLCRGRILSRCSAIRLETTGANLGRNESFEDAPRCYEPILSLQRQKVKSSFWDLQVLDTNNYVSIDGAIHHNSGKSVMCVWEMFERACAQQPYKGKRKTRWAIIRSCYDDQTEILTEKRGFQLFRNVKKNDKVATLQNDKLVWEQPNGISIFPYKGDMIGFEGEGVDFLVTPDHKLWASKRRTRKKVWGNYEQIEAEKAYGSQLWRIRRDAKWDSDIADYSDDVYEWLGFYFAEGSYGVYSNRRKCIITQVKQDGIDYTRKLFKRAGLKYTESKRKKGINFVLWSNGELANKMFDIASKAGKAATKKIPYRIRNAKQRCLRAFIKGFAAGDGGYSCSGRTLQLYTSSKILADQFQELALKAGYVANIASRDRIGKVVNIDGHIGKINHKEFIITLVNKLRYRPKLHKFKNRKWPSKRRGWYKQHYEGNVYCAEMPQPVVYVRRNGKAGWNTRTYPELMDTTLNTFLDWIPERKIPGYELRLVRQAPFHAYLTIALPDKTTVEAEFIFLALDNEDDVRKLKSLELTGCWINEASEIIFPVFKMARGRTRRYPSVRDGGYTWAGVLMDTNPPDEDHWWYKLAEEIRPENHKFWAQPPAILPIPKKNKSDPQLYEPNQGQDSRYLPAENVKNQNAGFAYWLDQTAGNDEMWIKVFLMGEYGSIMAGKPIYPEYKDDVHCAKEILEPHRGLPLVLGWDFGLTPCVAFMQLTQRGVLRVIDELCSENMGIREFSRYAAKPHLLNNYSGMKIVSFGDPAGTSRAQVSDELTCLQELREAGIPTEMARTNNFLTRREAVAGFLNRMVDGKPGFQLSPKCKVLRKGFTQKYKYRRLRTSVGERFTDEPDKLHPWSDCIAEGSLVTMADGTEKPIERVVAGDVVKTEGRNGKVTRAWLVRKNAKVMKLELSDGRTLLATSDHLIKCKDLWIPLDRLQYGDILHCIKNERYGVLCHQKRLVRPKNFKEESIADLDIITARYDALTERTKSLHCIAMYGNTSVVQYPMDMLSTTLITIQTITIYPILNFILFLNMLHTILEKDMLRIQSYLIKLFALLPLQLKFGIVLQKVENGIVSIAMKYGPKYLKKFVSAFYVTKSIKHVKDSQSAAFALLPVKAEPAEPAASMISRKPVLSVGKSLCLTSTIKSNRVVGVVGVRLHPQRRDVYDLTVEPDHSFYANGILVHNCHDGLQYGAMYLEGGSGGGVGGGLNTSKGGGSQRREVKRGNLKGCT